MSTVQLSGLASGFDWKTFVDQIIQTEGAPITALRAEQSTLTQKNAAIGALQTKMAALQTSIASLNDKTVFSQRGASLSNALWSATTTSSTAPASHTVTVTKLATASRLQGASDIGQAIRSDGDTSQVLISAMNLSQPITAGEFTVNGARVAVATTDTLEQVFQKISVATGGTVTASYDGGTDRVTLTGTGPVTLNSANDTSNFLKALKLTNNGSNTVQSATALGAAKLDSPLASSGLATALTGLAPDGSGSMVINGANIPYNANTDTIRTVLARINKSTAGVTATYDSAQDRIVLNNNVTGDLGASVQDTGGGNLAAALGLTSGATLVRGQDAQFSVDGGAVLTSASNTVDESVTGIAGLTFTFGSETTERINVTSDTSSASAKIQDLVAKYNDLQTFIDSQTATSTSGTKVSTSILTGDLGVRDLARSLRTQLFKAFSGGSGAVTRLQSLGIDFNGTSSQLVIKDQAKLDSMLQSNSSDVSAFFTDSSGFSTGLSKLIDHQTGTDGSLPREVATNTLRSTRITSKISDLQRRLDQERASLTTRFVQMEQAQSLLQSQLATLNNAFGTTSSSSKSSQG